jgi:hypothetical protein
MYPHYLSLARMELLSYATLRPFGHAVIYTRRSTFLGFLVQLTELGIGPRIKRSDFKQHPSIRSLSITTLVYSLVDSVYNKGEHLFIHLSHGDIMTSITKNVNNR